MKEGGWLPARVFLCLFCVISPFVESSSQNTTADQHFRKGKDLEKKNKPEEALVEYNTAIELDPYFVEAHRQRMDILVDQKKVDETQAYYKKFLQSCPERAGCHYLYGRALQNDSEALKHYLIARDLDPKFVWTYVALSYWTRKEMQFEQTLEHCKHGQTLDPSNSFSLTTARMRTTV